MNESQEMFWHVVVFEAISFLFYVNFSDNTIGFYA